MLVSHEEVVMGVYAAIREVFQTDLSLEGGTYLGDLGYAPVDLLHFSLALKHRFQVEVAELLSVEELEKLRHNPQLGAAIKICTIVSRVERCMPEHRLLQAG